MLRFIRTDPWGNRVHLNWGERLVVAGLLLYFLFFLFHVSMCLIFPNDLDNEEGFILNQIHQLRTGHTIYPTLMDYPYTVGNYPPLFQLFCVPLSEIFGDTHIIGRLFSILSTLGLGVLIFLITRELSGDVFGGLVAGLFPFGVHYVYRWAPYNRVDMPALLFSLLGLYFLFRKPQKIWIPILFFSLALFTKQTMFAAPIAGFLFLLRDNKKFAFVFLPGIIISCSVIFLILYIITGGQIYKHLVEYNMNPFHWGDVRNFYVNLFHFYWVFLLFVVVSFFLLVRDSKNCLWLLYFVFAFLVSLSCGKEGSAVNYLIEMMIAGSILAGIVIGISRKNVYYARIFIPVLVLIQLALIPHLPYTGYWYGFTPKQRDMDIARSVEWMVGNTPGDVLSDDASFLVRTKKPVLFQPFIMSTLARQGKWSSSKFIADIQKKRFSLVVLNFPLEDKSRLDYERYTPEILTALIENYTPEERRQTYWIYKPKINP